MFKKFFYLASVSVLASTAMIQESNAVYEEELLCEIAKHYQRKIDLPNKDKNEKTTTNVICDGLYHGVRSLKNAKDSIANGVVNLEHYLTNHTEGEYSYINTILSYVPIGKVVDVVESGVRTAAKNGISDETLIEEDTVGRTIRDFWKNTKKYNREDKLEDVCKSTAFALMHAYKIVESRDLYDDFIYTWNGSINSINISPELAEQYYLDGAISYYAFTGQEGYEDTISSLPLKKTKLPELSKITAASVELSKEERKTLAEMDEQGERERREEKTRASEVDKQRDEKFTQLVKSQYEKEKKLFSAEKEKDAKAFDALNSNVKALKELKEKRTNIILPKESIISNANSKSDADLDKKLEGNLEKISNSELDKKLNARIEDLNLNFDFDLESEDDQILEERIKNLSNLKEEKGVNISSPQVGKNVAQNVVYSNNVNINNGNFNFNEKKKKSKKLDVDLSQSSFF